MNADPVQTAIQIFAAVVGVIFVKWLDRKNVRRVQAKAEDASQQASNAAQQATTAADRSKEATTAATQTGDAVVLLAEELGKAIDVSQRTLEAMHRMAEQNDTQFGMYAAIVALARTQSTRLERLEQWAAEEEQRAHVTVTASTRTGATHGDD